MCIRRGDVWSGWRRMCPALDLELLAAKEDVPPTRLAEDVPDAGSVAAGAKEDVLSGGGIRHRLTHAPR